MHNLHSQWLRENKNNQLDSWMQQTVDLILHRRERSFPKGFFGLHGEKEFLTQEKSFTFRAKGRWQ